MFLTGKNNTPIKILRVFYCFFINQTQDSLTYCLILSHFGRKKEKFESKICFQLLLHRPGTTT